MRKLFVILLLMMLMATSAWAAQPIIRVGILRNVTSAEITGAGVFEVSYSKSDQTGYFNHGISIKIKDNSLYVETKKISSDKVFIRTEDSRVVVNKRNYRGTIQIINNAPQSFNVVEVLPMDEYVYGIIKNEISPRWPEEAIKAQIIVARTYALKNMGKHEKEGFDMCTTTDCQVYGGLDSEDPVSNQLVDTTRGQVLTYDDELISTPYHGICGGYTEEARNVWEGSIKVPYLQTKRCKYCQDAPHFAWSAKLERSRIEALLNAGGINVGTITNIKINDTSRSGRAIEMKITFKKGKVVLRANKFRLLLGADVIRSAMFKIKKDKDSYIFEGTGWGHGVGLCQEGAKGMAEKGYDYKKILQFYFPGTKISSWDY